MWFYWNVHRCGKRNLLITMHKNGLRQPFSIQNDRIKSTEITKITNMIDIFIVFFFHLFDYVLVYVSIFIAEYQDLAICFISFHFICHETLCNVSHLHRFRYNVICVCVFFFLCFRQRWKEIRVCLHYKYTQQMCWLRPNTPNVINDGSVDRHQWVVIYGSTCMRERHNVPSLRCIQNCHSHSVRVIWCKNGAKRMWRENVSTHADGTPENAISNFHWALDAVALHI